MITADHPLMQLLALIDMVWIEAEAGKAQQGKPFLWMAVSFTLPHPTVMVRLM